MTLDIEGDTIMRKTNGDGAYEVWMSHAPFRVDCTIIASKKGFATFRQNFSSDSHPLQLEITLQTNAPK